MNPTDTTNALRALAERVLGLTVVGEVCGTERNAIAAELRALATAQPEAKPEGVECPACVHGQATCGYHARQAQGGGEDAP